MRLEWCDGGVVGELGRVGALAKSVRKYTKEAIKCRATQLTCNPPIILSRMWATLIMPV